MKDKKKEKKKFTIELDEDQMWYLEHACEFMSRITCGQLGFTVQEVCEAAYEKEEKKKLNTDETSIGTKGWWEMRHSLEQHLSEIKKLCWGLSDHSSYGIGYDEKADCYWDMYQVLRHARFNYVFTDEQREIMRHTVMADKPFKAYSGGDLVIVKPKEEE